MGRLDDIIARNSDNLAPKHRRALERELDLPPIVRPPKPLWQTVIIMLGGLAMTVILFWFQYTYL